MDAEGRVRFVDTFEDGELVTRRVWERNPDGTVTTTTTVDVDGFRIRRRTYAYDAGVLSSVSTEQPGGSPSRCDYDIDPAGPSWTVECTEAANTYEVDPDAKTFTRRFDGNTSVLEYAGVFPSATTWHTEPPPGYITELAPIEETTTIRATTVTQTYEYDGDRLVGSAIAADGEVRERNTWGYDCP